MRFVALIVAATLLAVPATTDARRSKPHAKFRPGKTPALVGWRRPVMTLAGAAPVVPPVATATPGPAGPAPTATPAPAPSTVPGNNPHSVSVRSTEFRFSLSQASVDAGEVRVQFDNSAAEDPHALAYDGPTTGGYDPVAAGAVVRYTVTLSAGTYTLFCPLPEHEGLGMKATLTVR